MHVTYDVAANAAYIYLEHPVPDTHVPLDTKWVKESVGLDFMASGQLVGIEILAAREILPPKVLEDAERLG